jgi:hypothetical protein
MKTVIIDPVSPEFNRGSFCYSPYLLYSALVGDGDVRLLENVCAADLDNLPEADRYLIALWSAPQIEHVKTLVRFLPRRARVQVFGYAPWIKANNLPAYSFTPELILRGMRLYVYHFEVFHQILLSDCDMHLKNCTGQVYPFFTSYGCPMGCDFCPSTANQKERIVLPIEEVERNLSYMKDRGHTNIHFTDEDLFFDLERAQQICTILKNLGGFQLIALASRRTLSRVVETLGSQALADAGFKLLEVGLETADESLGQKMGKGGLEPCVRLAQACSVPILWLTLTFHPGETIRTLRETGLFLQKHGLPPTSLYDRIQTNGTYGGLGQFFQPYEGTRLFKDLVGLGEMLSARPLRLMPSFIPHSFSNDIIQQVSSIREEDQLWFDLYRISPPLHLERFVGEPVSSAAATYDNPEDGYIAMAICARIGAIG